MDPNANMRFLEYTFNIRSKDRMNKLVVGGYGGVVDDEADLARATARAEQLADASVLASATLPDGTKLSEVNWQAEFEEWCRKQERCEGERDEDDDDDGDRDHRDDEEDDRDKWDNEDDD